MLFTRVWALMDRGRVRRQCTHPAVRTALWIITAARMDRMRLAPSDTSPITHRPEPSVATMVAGIGASEGDFRQWHISDVAVGLGDVRYRGQSRRRNSRAGGPLLTPTETLGRAQWNRGSEPIRQEDRNVAEFKPEQ
jgi:hypothetical protein